VFALDNFSTLCEVLAEGAVFDFALGAVANGRGRNQYAMKDVCYE
jgi:hypothetical protein